jgi:uncharacterized SAM-binding protein YcdF (DUF218 family)
MVCGNGWLVGRLTQHLEWQYLPPNPVPQADCIVILSGCLDSQIPPRPTIEVTDAGDRVLYGWHLYRQGRAPLVICTGGVSAGGVAVRPAAQDMADFLEHLGMPRNAILTETNSSNTREHPVNLAPVFRDRGIKRVLLVTSAMHMPRSVGVFKRWCPEVEFIATPTDFRTTVGTAKPWYYRLNSFIPSPGNLLAFSDATHEYLGMLYYKMRGWM